MSITLAKLKEKIKKVSNEYSINAQIVSDSNTHLSDIFTLRIKDFINICLSKIFREYLVSAVKEYSLYPVVSSTGKGGFNTVQHLNNDIIYSFTGIRSLYFEADNVGSVEITTITAGVESATTIETSTTIVLNGYKNKFKGYRKQIAVADSIKVTFKGDYPYRIRNIGTYVVNFANEIDIPEYKPMINLISPDNVLQFDTVKLEDSNGELIDFGGYEILNNNIVVPYDTVGNLIYTYFRTPIIIPDTAPEDYVIDIVDLAVDCLCYHVASMCMQEYNNELSALLYNKGELALSSLSKFTSNIEPTHCITDVRGW